MIPTINVVLAGVGGQGVLLASEVLSRAAVFSGFDVKTNEVHGMAQRGGSVTAHIRYGERVHSPLVEVGTAHVLASFERIESLRSAEYLAEGGLSVVSSQKIVPVTVSSGKATYPADAEERIRKRFSRLVYLDAVGIAEQAGNVRCSNMVLLGALSTALELDRKAWTLAIERSVKPAVRSVNVRAFEQGAQAALGPPA